VAAEPRRPDDEHPIARRHAEALLREREVVADLVQARHVLRIDRVHGLRLGRSVESAEGGGHRAGRDGERHTNAPIRRFRCLRHRPRKKLSYARPGGANRLS
jgi:hypothetical protein